MKFTIETENVSHAKALLAYLGALQGEPTELLRTTPDAPAPEVRKEKAPKAPKEVKETPKVEAPAPEVKAEEAKIEELKEVAAASNKAPWDEEPEVKEVKKEITIDDLRRGLKGYSDKYSVEKALEMVKEFGGTRLSDIKPENYAALLAKLTA